MNAARNLMVVTGIGLIVAAVAPTPDDITIVSPVVQFITGAGLIIAGLRKRK